MEYTRNGNDLSINDYLEELEVYDKDFNPINLLNKYDHFLLLCCEDYNDKDTLNELQKINTILENSPIPVILVTNNPMNPETHNHLHLDNMTIYSDFKLRNLSKNLHTFIYENESMVKLACIIKNNKLTYIKYLNDDFSNYPINELNEYIKKL